MTKSNIEKQYDKLIIHHISNIDVCSAHRAAFFLDFYQNGRSYYDELCDLLYIISVGELLAPLWMSHSGQVYASTHPRQAHDVFLSDCREIPAFSGDLVEHLDYIFSRIYSLSNTSQTLQLCKTR